MENNFYFEDDDWLYTDISLKPLKDVKNNNNNNYQENEEYLELQNYYLNLKSKENNDNLNFELKEKNIFNNINLENNFLFLKELKKLKNELNKNYKTFIKINNNNNNFNKKEIKQFKYNNKKDLNYNQNKCCICLNLIDINDKLLVINNCNHIFHKNCLNKWLLEKKHCPICRNKIIN